MIKTWAYFCAYLLNVIIRKIYNITEAIVYKLTDSLQPVL